MEKRSWRSCVAVLDTMWTGNVRKAPAYFRINPHNRTGARLYKLLDGLYDLRVTNACPHTVTHAKEHGVYDATWLASNIKRLCPIDLLLVCGNVAQQAYFEAGIPDMSLAIGHTILMPHPAWRGWSTATLASMKAQIASTIKEA